METEANHIFPPAEPVKPVVQEKPGDLKVTADKPKTETKEDHLAIIAQLASNLHNVSPSGAETVRDQILERVAAIQDPKAYDEKIAAQRKTEQEAEAVRAKAREDAKKATKVA